LKYEFNATSPTRCGRMAQIIVNTTDDFDINIEDIDRPNTVIDRIATTNRNAATCA
jgi:hypothetical protein